MTDAMWKAVAAKLDDDAPRAVLADALLERNDPRGEFISLQLEEHRGVGSNAKAKAAQSLLTKHERLWLGPLHAIASEATYVRGMVQSLSLASTEAAIAAATTMKSTSSDALLTLETVSASPAVVRAWLEHGTAPNLAGLKLDVHRVNDWVAVLEANPARWKSLELWDCDLAGVPPPVARQQLKRVLKVLERCTALSCLTCEPWVLRALPDAVLQRLVDVRLRFTPMKKALAAIEGLTKLRFLSCRLGESGLLRPHAASSRERGVIRRAAGRCPRAQGGVSRRARSPPPSGRRHHPSAPESARDVRRGHPLRRGARRLLHLRWVVGAKPL